MKKVYLSGTCGNSKWRDKFINKFKENSIDYFNPSVKNWSKEIEGDALKQTNNSNVIVTVITGETYSLGALSEMGLKFIDKNAGDITFIIFIENSLDELLKADIASADTSIRLRGIILEHLKRIKKDNIILTSSADECLSKCIELCANINTPNTFIKRVEIAYPDYPKLIELIKSDSILADEYFNGSYGAIGEEDVLGAFSLGELQNKAKLIKERKNLHEEWRNIHNMQNKDLFFNNVSLI